MSLDVEEYVRYQIANAKVSNYPFPHLFVHPVFPTEFYEELLAHLPPTSILTHINEYGTVGVVNSATGKVVQSAAIDDERRYIGDLATLEEDEELNGRGDLWRRTADWIMSDAFRSLVVQKFAEGIRQRFGEHAKLITDSDSRFVRDFTAYLIRPHTDMPSKLVSLLFYLPRDESMRNLGTSIYRPLDPAMRCDGTTRHPFKKFKKVATMEFLPNSMFGFLRTDQSFHGVEQIQEEAVERNVLLYNVYLRKVVKPVASRVPGAGPGGSGPPVADA